MASNSALANQALRGQHSQNNVTVRCVKTPKADRASYWQLPLKQPGAMPRQRLRELVITVTPPVPLPDKRLKNLLAQERPPHEGKCPVLLNLSYHLIVLLDTQN
eukprot:scaffold138773_cov39-Prasinocladus_malaysianus.AAC.2